jgi:hypothetical protein
MVSAREEPGRPAGAVALVTAGPSCGPEARFRPAQRNTLAANTSVHSPMIQGVVLEPTIRQLQAALYDADRYDRDIPAVRDGLWSSVQVQRPLKAAGLLSRRKHRKLG